MNIEKPLDILPRYVRLWVGMYEGNTSLEQMEKLEESTMSPTSYL